VAEETPVKIRVATEDDLGAIVGLLADDDLGRRREAFADPLPGEYRDAFAAIDTDPNNLVVVAEDEGEVVGTLQLTFIPNLSFRGGWRAQIEGVRTASGRRGEGLGRALLEWAIEEADRRGCHLVQLTMNRGRGEVVRFYEGLGFDASHVGFKRYLRGDVTGR
jgi:GNAT superfamily N-acetyltransferase